MKTPGEALLRKCINPLRYFHPEAAKYRGLSEGSARRMRLLQQLTPKEFVIASPARTLDVAIRSPHAWGRIPTSAFSGLLGMTEFHRRGQPGLQLPCAGKPRRGLPAASLGSTASIVRARGGERNALCDPRFSKITKRGLAISYKIGYTVCREKRKATVSRLLQQAIWKQSFFMCGLSFRGPQPSAVQSSGIPPFFDSASSDFLCASPSFKWFPL